MATGVDAGRQAHFRCYCCRPRSRWRLYCNQKPPTRFSAIDPTRPMVGTDADRSSKLKHTCQNSRRDFLPGLSHLGVALTKPHECRIAPRGKARCRHYPPMSGAGETVEADETLIGRIEGEKKRRRRRPDRGHARPFPPSRHGRADNRRELPAKGWARTFAPRWRNCDNSVIPSGAPSCAQRRCGGDVTGGSFRII
jgi:hypothetical protein